MPIYFLVENIYVLIKMLIFEFPNCFLTSKEKLPNNYIKVLETQFG